MNWFVGILTLIFVMAKILGLITWSWFWVFSPILVSFGILAAVLVSLLIGALVSVWFSK